MWALNPKIGLFHQSTFGSWDDRSLLGLDLGSGAEEILLGAVKLGPAKDVVYLGAA